jgi:hypothetical protein
MFPTNGDSRSLVPPMHSASILSMILAQAVHALGRFQPDQLKRLGTAHKSIEPRAGEPDRGLLVTGTGGKIK